ncbi:hypothetical protein [Bythopirellula polymerisocia]|uniref:Carbonic anhydrase n=1 Tax=Bythopirellula polymerisocia TaxID=2528003 RepID=A0A5C6D2C3_9BACT|nr:hypothetical protein [Bythopirellula polymerisocia]TWU29994.1 hypothetical protein Pla144_07750 [Bythopirellula polymerisocia]
MITTRAHAPESIFVDSRFEILDNSSASIETLVIALDDPYLIRCLRESLSNESAALLPISEDSLNQDGQSLAQEIERALHKLDLSSIVFVGHSMSRWACRKGVSSSTGGNGDFSSVISGVKHFQSQSQESQKRFVSQFQQLAEIPVIASRVNCEELAISGLFYRAESGLFLAYDPALDQFQPLLN